MITFLNIKFFKNYGSSIIMLLSLRLINSQNDKFGKFQSDEEYFNALKTLINSSSELNNKTNFLNNKVLPYVKKESILDIGIGNGEFSKTIYENFNIIHLVDPSKIALNFIQNNEFSNKIIEKFSFKIEDFSFPSNFYDLILNCHTLYHLTREDWKNTIERSCESLNSQGIQLVVINNGLARSQLTNFFGNCNIINIEKLIEECVSIKNVTVEIYPFYEQSKTKFLKEAVQIATIFLQDVNIFIDNNHLITYLNNNCKKENYFIIDYCQYFIILRKNN